MRAHRKANSGHAGNHATSYPGVPFVMRWKSGPRGRDPRADQKGSRPLGTKLWYHLQPIENDSSSWDRDT